MTRKYISISVAFAFLLFALGLMAQANSGQTTNPPSGTTSSQNPNSPAGDEMSMPSQSGSTSGSRSETSASSAQSSQTGSSADQSSQSGSSMGQSGQSSSSMGQSSQTASSGKAKTVEGCVVREEADYFLVPKRGNPIRVSSAGTGDISSHVGHHVKAHGTENTASNMGAGTSSQAGTSGTVAGGTGSGTSAKAGEETSGSVGTSTNPPSGASGTAGASTGSLHAAANQEIVVDRVDMVSETCASNWNPTYNPNATKGNKSKSDQSNY